MLPESSFKQYFFGYVSSGKGNKSENKQSVLLHQTKKLLHSEGYSTIKKKRQTTEWKDIFKQYI